MPKGFIVSKRFAGVSRNELTWIAPDRHAANSSAAEILAKHPDPEIREMAAWNTLLSFKSLARLADQDPEPKVRERAAITLEEKYAALQRT